MKISVISSSLFCTPLLTALQKSGIETNVWAAPGEQQQLTGWCSHHGIKASAEKEPDGLYAWLKQQNPTLAFVIGYNRHIKTRKLPAQTKTYNIHFGPLPSFRGPSPVFWQLKQGQKELGLAIHELSDKMDAGDIVWEKRIINEPHHTYTFVHLLFSELLTEGVFEVINRQAAGLKGKPQDETQARTYSRPKLNDVLIDWQKMKAGEIVDLIKACNAWNTGALTSFYGNELTLIDASVKEGNDAPVKGGIITGTNNELTIGCQGGQVLTIHYLRFNQLPLPGRWAAQLGFTKGQSLGT